MLYTATVCVFAYWDRGHWTASCDRPTLQAAGSDPVVKTYSMHGAAARREH